MFELPKRQFEFKDFEPVVDAKTMEIHYSKHHQAYVDNLNKLLPDDMRSVAEVLKQIDSLPVEIRQGVVNNAGGHWNHTFWWEQLRKPIEVNVPTGVIFDAICSKFGTFDTFKELFTKAAMTSFGSGWSWLLVKKDGELSVESSPNQDSPIAEGKRPLLALDVWEHAYYLNYQNRRVDYVNAFWQIVDWKVVAGRLK